MQVGTFLGNIASVLSVPTEEAGIVSELKAGSEDAFAWLIAKYHQPIYSLDRPHHTRPCGRSRPYPGHLHQDLPRHR